MTSGTATTVVEIHVSEQEPPATGAARGLGGPQGGLPAAGMPGPRPARAVSFVPRTPWHPHIPCVWRNNQVLEHHFGSPQTPRAFTGTLHHQLWGQRWPKPTLRRNSEAACLVHTWGPPQRRNQHHLLVSLAQQGLSTDPKARNFSAHTAQQ